MFDQYQGFALAKIVFRNLVLDLVLDLVVTNESINAMKYHLMAVAVFLEIAVIYS